MVRDLLIFQPLGAGTDIRLALDTVHQMLKRRSIVFLVSDFLIDPGSYRQAMLVTNRRHDVVAFDLSDPLEHDIGDVGVMALEDAESGQFRWIDTGSREWRREFAERVARLEEGKRDVFTAAGVDRISVTTEKDYVRRLGRSSGTDCEDSRDEEWCGLWTIVLCAARRSYGHWNPVPRPISDCRYFDCRSNDTALAQNPPPAGILISFTSDRSELTVGDPVTLTLGVMHSEDQAVVLPGIGPEWGPFEVWSQTAAQTISNGDGTKTTFQQLQVTLLRRANSRHPMRRSPSATLTAAWRKYFQRL